jgi:hypothetical protein
MRLVYQPPRQYIGCKQNLALRFTTTFGEDLKLPSTLQTSTRSLFDWRKQAKNHEFLCIIDAAMHILPLFFAAEFHKPSTYRVGSEGPTWGSILRLV